MNCQGCQGGSRERILPTCGPSLITPKGQRRDPDASDDKKTQTKAFRKVRKERISGVIILGNNNRQ